MAQYTINHSCGHTEVVQLYGPGKDRDSSRAWMEKQPCQDCKRTKEAVDVETKATTLDLAELTGSEKQIAWAKKIRQTFINQFEAGIPQSQREARPEEAARARAAFIHVVNAHTDSRFWIDNRNDSVRIFATEYQAAFNAGKD